MRISSLLTVFVLGLSFSAYGQNFYDALRFSQYDITGTARYLGVGGTMSAIGGDMTTLSTNPAGIAWQRSSEFSFTPSLNLISTDGEFTGAGPATALSDDRWGVHFSNIGFIGTKQPNSQFWRTFNFGLGFTRLANFQQHIQLEAQSGGSIVQAYQAEADRLGLNALDNFTSGLAFDAGAIYDFDGDGVFQSDYDFASESATLKREQEIRRKGGINEVNLAIAGNLQEKLMLGIGVGVPIVNYEEEKTYTEEDTGAGVEGDLPFFDELELKETNTTDGIGFNFKIGAIYRISQTARVGLAVHSPTWYSLQDTFYNDLRYFYTDNGEQVGGDAESPFGFFEYKLRTPWRYQASAGFIIAKRGFIGIEADYIDYSATEYIFNGFSRDEDAVNDDVFQNLASVLHLRVGGEYALNNWRFRAGAGIRNAVLETQDKNYIDYSAGVGYRWPYFFIDMALRSTQQSSNYQPYEFASGPVQPFALDKRNNALLVTLGFKL